MKLYGIDRYEGEWVSGSGSRVRIRKVSNTEACVDYFGSADSPMIRPFLQNSPSLDMTAHYDEYYGEFGVELWERGKGLVLHLLYEENYALDNRHREALVPSIGRYEKDHYLECFCNRICLNHFVRTSEAEPVDADNQITRP